MVAGVAALVVLTGTAWAKEWQVPADFATIQAAIDSPMVLAGDRILVAPGFHGGAVVTKAVEIKGQGGAVINSGPLPWPTRTFRAGFLFPGGGEGNGATISHLAFETVEFPVFSRGADNVTVTQCRMANPIQGISNWLGSDWEISHNVIEDLQTANGGGIGILVGDYTGGVRQDNLISHNKITGTLHVASNDGGGYDGSGIVLYADFRWGRDGAKAIAYNRVVKNKVALKSDRPSVVDVAAIELTQSFYGHPNPSTEVFVFQNAVGFNDLRGTVKQIVLTPSTLDANNSISRNLGENRGQGLHPSAFRPQ